LVRSDGRVMAIDYGACFEKLYKGPPALVRAPIPAYALSLQRAWGDIAETIERIRGLPEEAIICCFAQIPENGPWQGSAARRIATAEWLLSRRDTLGAALKKQIASVT
jgi:hypothetical protein